MRAFAIAVCAQARVLSSKDAESDSGKQLALPRKPPPRPPPYIPPPPSPSIPPPPSPSNICSRWRADTCVLPVYLKGERQDIAVRFRKEEQSVDVVGGMVLAETKVAARVQDESGNLVVELWLAGTSLSPEMKMTFDVERNGRALYLRNDCVTQDRTADATKCVEMWKRRNRGAWINTMGTIKEEESA